MSESSEVFALITTRVGEHGPDVRLFNIWPGLFRHHIEFSDGHRMWFDREFGLTLVSCHGTVLPLKAVFFLPQSLLEEKFRQRAGAISRQKCPTW